MIAHDFAGAPCQGMARLFESTDINDHAQARAICGTCRHRFPCHQRHDEARHAATYDGWPQGTWAGLLYDHNGQRVDVPDDDELAQARRRRELDQAWRKGAKSSLGVVS